MGQNQIKKSEDYVFLDTVPYGGRGDTDKSGMTPALSWCVFLKNRVVSHQWVQKFQLSLAFTRRTLNRCWLALYQTSI